MRRACFSEAMMDLSLGALQAHNDEKEGKIARDVRRFA